MATIKFFIQSKNNPAGIYVRLKDGRTIDAKAKTRFVVSPSDWSSAKGFPHLRNNELKNLDSDLTELSTNLKHSYNQAVSDELEIDTPWLKQFLSPTVSKEIPDYLLTYIDYYILLKSSSITANTLKKVKSYKVLLTTFEKWARKKYKIHEVDNDFQIKLEEFGSMKNYGKNYMSGVLSYTKTFCRHAYKQGIRISKNLDDLNISKQKTKFVYLNFEELIQLEKAELKTDYLDNARDWLLISCDTAQRVSDFMEFSKDKIRKGKDRNYLDFTQQKTGKNISISLSPRVERILAKRNGDFPRKTSDVKYNKYIKIVCKNAKMNEFVFGAKKSKETNRMIYGKFPKYELITSHIGRRSWATNYFGTYPNSLLMSWTGHSAEKDFLNYIGKSNTVVSNHLADLIY